MSWERNAIDEVGLLITEGAIEKLLEAKYDGEFWDFANEEGLFVFDEEFMEIDDVRPLIKGKEVQEPNDIWFIAPIDDNLSVDEMIVEAKEILQEYMIEDFDIESNLVRVSGAMYGQ